ncbi:branched-chain alpha-keto acid dehydrogenase subunit E2 [compost metagenome]
MERPWAEKGMVVARSLIHSSLAGDHRVSEGHRGALFLRAIGELLQKPESL